MELVLCVCVLKRMLMMGLLLLKMLHDILHVRRHRIVGESELVQVVMMLVLVVVGGLLMMIHYSWWCVLNRSCSRRDIGGRF